MAPRRIKPAKSWRPPTKRATPVSKSTMKQVVTAWAGTDALEKCDGMPDMDDEYGVWLNRWCDKAAPLPDTTHAIEIGSPVWMLVLDKGTDVVIDHPTNYPRDTKYEWTFSGKLAWSDGDVVFVPFIDVIPHEDDPSLTIMGFFVPLVCLYIPESRKGKAARTGKQIEREVKLAKSTGKGEWTVLVYKDGTASCNCPSWIYHHDENGGCKHTKKVI